MTIIDSITLLWEQQSAKQKWLIGVVCSAVLLLMVSGWADSAYSNFKVRRAERAAEKAKWEANGAIEKASKIASEIREREVEVRELEAKRDVKKTELDKSKQATNNAQSDYDRAVREPISETPSTDELCSELAKLGYPCR